MSGLPDGCRRIRKNLVVGNAPAVAWSWVHKSGSLAAINLPFRQVLSLKYILCICLNSLTLRRAPSLLSKVDVDDFVVGRIHALQQGWIEPRDFQSIDNKGDLQANPPAFAAGALVCKLLKTKTKAPACKADGLPTSATRLSNLRRECLLRAKDAPSRAWNSNIPVLRPRVAPRYCHCRDFCRDTASKPVAIEDSGWLRQAMPRSETVLPSATSITPSHCCYRPALGC